jgi:hypothetical protein
MAGYTCSHRGTKRQQGEQIILLFYSKQGNLVKETASDMLKIFHHEPGISVVFHFLQWTLTHIPLLSRSNMQ